MMWKCPACQTQIRHEGISSQPNPLYRCHVCRLELVRNPETNLLEVAPLPSDEQPKRRETDTPNA
jgi:transposase-like protein